MLCRSCRRQVPRGALFCGRCGAPQAKGVRAPLDLLIGETRVPLTQTITLGRADDERRHAGRPDRVAHARAGARDGVRHVDRGRRLEPRHACSTTARCAAARRSPRARSCGSATPSSGSSATRTRSTPGRTVMLDAVGRRAPAAGAVRDRAAARLVAAAAAPGCALKQLEEDEGDQRWVLRDEDGAKYLRMGDAEAAPRAGARRRRLARGPAGRERARPGRRPGRPGWRGSWPTSASTACSSRPATATTRSSTSPGCSSACSSRASGRSRTPTASSRPPTARAAGCSSRRRGSVLLAAIAVVGFVAFLRLALTGHVHAVRGRRPPRLGRGRVPRRPARGRLAARDRPRPRRRLVRPPRAPGRREADPDLPVRVRRHVGRVVRAAPAPHRRQRGRAGHRPVVAGAAAIVATLASAPAPTSRSRSRSAPTSAALFNLNPLLDRDGYHILVDLLRQPGLRARSRQRLQLRLAGRPVPPGLSRGRRPLRRCGAGMVAGVRLLCHTCLDPLLQRPRPAGGQRAIVWALFGIFYAMLFLPIVISVGQAADDAPRQLVGAAVADAARQSQQRAERPRGRGAAAPADRSRLPPHLPPRPRRQPASRRARRGRRRVLGRRAPRPRRSRSASPSRASRAF